MADKSIGAYVGGPEDRVVAAKLGFGPTVRTSGTYLDRKTQGALLSVSASPVASDKFYKNVTRVPAVGTPLSLTVSVVNAADMSASEKLQVIKDTIKAWTVGSILADFDKHIAPLKARATPENQDDIDAAIVRIREWALQGATGSVESVLGLFLLSDIPGAREAAVTAMNALKGAPTEHPLRSMPSDVYREYCQERFYKILGGTACTLHHTASATIPGGLESLDDMLPNGLHASPGYAYSYVARSQSLTTGIPNCTGGLGSSATNNDYTYEWGRSYEYYSYGIAFVSFPYYRREIVSGIRYDTASGRYIVEHSSMYTVATVRHLTAESSSHFSEYYGSYGTFNPWDNCTYAQQFHRTTNSTRSSDSYQKDDRIHLSVQESFLPTGRAGASSPSAIYAKITLPLGNVSALVAGGTVPCTVQVYAGAYSVTLSGTFNIKTMRLTTDRYNPLGVAYYELTSMPQVTHPESFYQAYHTTLEQKRVAEGFYYCYPAAGGVNVRKDDVLSTVDVTTESGQRVGKLAYEFYVELPSAFTSRYFVCTSVIPDAEIQRSVLYTLFPTYPSDAEMSAADVYGAARDSVVQIAKTYTTLAHAPMCRACDLGVILSPITTLFDEAVTVKTEASTLSGVTGVSVSVVPPESRGSTVSETSHTASWPIMAPWGMEGWGDGVDSTSISATPDPAELVWSTLDSIAYDRYAREYMGASRVEAVKYTGLCYEKEATTTTSGRYTNGYARPIDTVSESTTHHIKATATGAYTLLLAGNTRPIIASSTPLLAEYTTTSTETSEYAYGSPTISTQTSVLAPASSMTYALCDATGARFDVLTVAFSGFTISTTCSDGVNHVWEVDDAGTLSVSSIVGTLDPDTTGRSISTDALVGVVSERIGHVAGAFLFSGASSIKRIPLEYTPPEPFAFPAPVAGSPQNAELSWLTAPYQYNGSLNFSAMPQTVEGGPVVWPNGWELRVIDAVTGVSVHTTYTKFVSSWVRFSIPWTSNTFPSRWYFLIAPYCNGPNGTRYYGSNILTGPVLGSPGGCNAVGGTVSSVAYDFREVYGQNGYYGGAPPGEPGPSINAEGNSTRHDAYLGERVVPPSIGMDVGYEEWKIGEAIRYVPFILYSNITGAEGYCVGARATSIRDLPYIHHGTLSRLTYFKIIEFIDEVIQENAQNISDMEADNDGTDADVEESIRTLYDYHNILVSISVKYGERSTQEAIRGEEEPDRELLYSIFIEETVPRVKILRNDFASPEVLFSIAPDCVGYSFLQQAPRRKGATVLASLWS